MDVHAARFQRLCSVDDISPLVRARRGDDSGAKVLWTFLVHALVQR